MTTPDHTLTDAEREALDAAIHASLRGVIDRTRVHEAVETILAARLAALATVRADAGRDALLAAADAAEALWRRWVTNTGPESPTAAWLRARAEAVGDDHA